MPASPTPPRAPSPVVGSVAQYPSAAHARLRTMLVIALLSALIVVLGLTPAGFVPVPTPAGSATTIHIPVIIAALVEGPVAGAVTGLLFGAFSFWRALTAAPNPIARLMFSDPLIAFGPRLLIGVVAYLSLRASANRGGRWVVALLVAAALGDATYRLAGGFETSVQSPYPGVTWMGLAAALVVAGAAAWAALKLLRHREVGPALAALLGSLTNTAGVLGLATWKAYLPWQVSLGIGVVQGLPEALVAMVLTMAVHGALQRAGFVRPPAGHAGTPAGSGTSAALKG